MPNTQTQGFILVRANTLHPVWDQVRVLKAQGLTMGCLQVRESGRNGCVREREKRGPNSPYIALEVG